MPYSQCFAGLAVSSTYSLFPHRGDTHEAGVYAMSAAISRTAAFTLDGLEPNRRTSLMSCDGETVSIEAIKPAEDGDGLIVRLCEHANKRCTAYLTVQAPVHPDQTTGKPKQIAQAWQCDLLEQNETEVKRTSRGIALSFRPCEIKTVRIKLQDADRP